MYWLEFESPTFEDRNEEFQTILNELNSVFPQQPPVETVIKEDSRHYGEGYADARDTFAQANGVWTADLIMCHRDMYHFVTQETVIYLIPLFWKYALSQNGTDISNDLNADISGSFKNAVTRSVREHRSSFSTQQLVALVKAIDFLVDIIEKHGHAGWAEEVRQLASLVKVS